MYNKLAKKILKKLDLKTPKVTLFNEIIEKKNKTDKTFEKAFEIGEEIYHGNASVFRCLKKLIRRNNFSILKKAEYNELLYLFKEYKKVDHDFKVTSFFQRILTDRQYEQKQSRLLIKKNTLFVFNVNYITRNFCAITLPADYDVNKFRNDSQKVSLINFLNDTNWSEYFDSEDVKRELISFSKSILETNWWNHSKYYRNTLVHRISLDTHYSANYEKMNIRIKCYLPVLTFLSLKYFVYNLLAEIQKNEDAEKLLKRFKKFDHKELKITKNNDLDQPPKEVEEVIKQQVQQKEAGTDKTIN